MEAEVSSSSSNSAPFDHKGGKELVRVKRKTIEKVLEQCQRALESLGNADALIDDEEDDRDDDGGSQEPELSRQGSMAIRDEREVDELCDLLKSRVGCPDFLEKLECAQPPVTPNTAEENSSWDFINENDLWEREDTEADKDEYVVVMQEDIVDGIACFMATYLASLKETKELSPNQLQEALSKTFSTKKKKGKLRKAWDGSKVLYNVASWGATAIGIYQNPLLFNAASKAFWTSCHVISKLL